MMSGDYARWLAIETAAYLAHDKPACPVCRDTGIVTSPDPGGESACPEPGCTTLYPVAADFTDTGEEPF